MLNDEQRGGGRVRQRKTRGPVADPAPHPAYDRTTGRVTPQPDGSPASRVAPADGDDDHGDGGDARLFRAPAPQDVAASLERRAYKRAKARHWSEAYPLRMRRWIEHSMHDIGSRIFCEVAVRVPMARVGKDEVLGLVEPYGAVEYVHSLDRAAAIRAGPAAANANNNAGVRVDSVTAHAVQTGAMDTGHTHIVRFQEGLDAVRCFLELNGAVIDPARYNAAVEQVSALVAGGVDNAAGDEEEDAAKAAADEDAIDRARNEVIESMSIANATRGAKPQDLIFVTVDFFRSAFAEPAPCGGTPARSSLPVAASKGPRFAVKPTGETPVQWLARRLAQQAEEAAHWFPIVSSHQPMTWEGFCTAANLAAFTLVTPTPNAFYATTLPSARTLDPMTQEEVRERRWEPSHWSVAVEALPRANYDPDDLQRMVDVSSSAEELMRGLRHKATWRTTFMLRMHRALHQSPKLGGVLLLLIAALLAAVTIFVFRQRLAPAIPASNTGGGRGPYSV